MARSDLDAMFAFLAEFAQMMLAQQGEFYPFGAGMTHEGDMTSLGADTGTRRPKSNEVIGLLHSALAEQAASGRIKASGICMDVRVVPPGAEIQTDAICVELQHWDGEAIDVFVPYTITPSGVVYGQVFATPGEQTIFLPVVG
jgi:hypothetical protein